jgi:L-2-hydroxyglutarate oxidase LhgO
MQLPAWEGCSPLGRVMCGTWPQTWHNSGMDAINTVVIGAGVVGLAVARALALSGREVLVLEKEEAIGTETSARNSEVIHAGIYYPVGSLKAKLCVQGKEMLYAYAQERGVAHQRCGKLIVATSADEVGQLAQIQRKAAANGVELQALSADEARALEPALTCEAALLSPSTGIVDSHGLMLSLQGDLENAGGMVALNSALQSAVRTPQGWVLQVQDPNTGEASELLAQTVVNASGLHAPVLARQFGLQAPLPQAHYAKGNYFTLAGRAPFSRLIYPVPQTAGLGVHLTLDLGGQAKFGPDVQWVDGPQDLQVDPARGDAFYAEVRQYWPDLPDGALLPGYAGIRPKIQAPGEAAKDFLIQGETKCLGEPWPAHGAPALVNLFGIESPGLTSSLAVGQTVLDMLAA